MDSILTSVKKALGITEDYEYFDADLIMHINSVFSILTQMGVGGKSSFSISDKTANWYDFTSNEKLEAIKSYMYLKVKLMFDPPSSSIVMESMKRNIDELEWRLHVISETDIHYDDKEDSCFIIDWGDDQNVS